MSFLRSSCLVNTKNDFYFSLYLWVVGKEEKPRIMQISLKKLMKIYMQNYKYNENKLNDEITERTNRIKANLNNDKQ